MTSSELASQLGVTSTTIYNWEQGRNLPASELLPSLATVLNTTIDSIMLYSSKDRIKQSITKYFFDLDLDEYAKALDLVKLNDKISSDAEMEFRLLSMEMTHITHQSHQLIRRFDSFESNYGDNHQSMTFRIIRQKLQLQVLYEGGAFVLELLKKENEIAPSLMNRFKLIQGFLITGHSLDALQLCKKSQEEWLSPEFDILLAECKRNAGQLDEAISDLLLILKKRLNYNASIIIRAHEVLYRILLLKHDHKEITEILKDSINWLPEEYAKDGYDAIQARHKMQERMNRFLRKQD